MTNTEMIAELEKHPAGTELEIVILAEHTRTYLINTDKAFHFRQYKDIKALQILCGNVEIVV